jgi:hypothetical protein
MKKTLSLIVLGILVVYIMVSCIQQPTEPNSGIEGQVFIGPMCPVMKVGEECPDEPYQAVLSVNSPKGERIAQVQTDENGLFRIPLEPGEYILHPESPNVMPFANEQAVVVKEGSFTKVIVSYDSGIR